MGAKKKAANGGGSGGSGGNGTGETTTSMTGNGAGSSPYAQLSFTDVLEDLSSRFIVNLPSEEQASIQRICFQVEQAHWFYEDFLRPLNPSLPSLALRRFSSYLLHTAALTVPLIQKYIASSSSGTGHGGSQSVQGLEAAFDEFLKYKTRVPVCGAVMLNASLDKCILVKGWKSSAAWGFPKGKINQQETERDCAVREVLEETGFDCGPLLPSDSVDFMELTMREQKIRLYIVPGLDEKTQFETQTRKEISKIAWFKLSDLPTWKKNKAPPQGMGGKFYLISPFIGKLKQWIQDNRSKHKQASIGVHSLAFDDDVEESTYVEEGSEDRSSDLKALLGMSEKAQVRGHDTIAGKGSQMIEEQGDERGRQLLDLLRGAPSAVNVLPGPPTDFGHVSSSGQNGLDDRERGTASLLAALNIGAGKAANDSAPAADDGRNEDTSLALLSLLNASDQSASDEIPLHAPQAQRTGQAQSLLSLISPSTSLSLAPHQAATLAPDANLQWKATLERTGNGNNGMPDDQKEFERSQKRDKLLSNLLSSSLSLQSPQPNGARQSGHQVFSPPTYGALPFPPPPPHSQGYPTSDSHNVHLALLNGVPASQPYLTPDHAPRSPYPQMAHQYANGAPVPYSQPPTHAQQYVSPAPSTAPQSNKTTNPLLNLLNGGQKNAAAHSLSPPPPSTVPFHNSGAWPTSNLPPPPPQSLVAQAYPTSYPPPPTSNSQQSFLTSPLPPPPPPPLQNSGHHQFPPPPPPASQHFYMPSGARGGSEAQHAQNLYAILASHPPPPPSAAYHS